jgi:argininosuccinate lyase
MADYLVAKDVPFREAHGIVSALVDIAAARKSTIAELSIEEFKAQSPVFQNDIYEVTALASATARDVPGGTAPDRVAEAMRNARARLEARGASA